MKKLSTLLSFLVLSLFSQAQLSPIWSLNCGGNNMDILENCCYGKENKYTFVGNTRSTNHDITTNHGGVDAWIYIKNADGSTFYSKTLDGTF
ncbi:MAG: hypothetical protein PHR81_11020, partial [Bacteroidales bacterium]|nr:hypothetical protein [Bacteroidales bacterium]